MKRQLYVALEMLDNAEQDAIHHPVYKILRRTGHEARLITTCDRAHQKDSLDVQERACDLDGMSNAHITRAQAFCERFRLRRPILLAPMAGACPPSLSIVVA